ncbi:MAG: flagellar basal body L-ring protein FlgH [Acidobacteriota bacterium]
MNARAGIRSLTGAALVIVCAGSAIGQTNAKAKKATQSDNYDEVYAHYLQQARTPPPTAPDQWGWMNGLTSDSRARRVNDLVTVRVEESITASGSADASTSKATNTSNSIGGLFGLSKFLPSAVDPTALANTKSDNGFKGSGATNRAGTLSTLMTARVADVLPSGDLVVEGVREIGINGDRQMVVLTGVVRPVDVGPTNVVSSTQIGQLRIQYFGQGLMKDSLNPGWLLRFLNKVF